MDEIGQRLRESADACFKSYEAWRKSEKDNGARTSLQDSVHELRKIASRIEIELAVSERNEMAQKPIPIPPHRDARGRHQSGPSDVDDDIGNAQNERPKQAHAGGGQRRPQRTSLGGSQGGPRKEPPGNDAGGDD